MYCNLSDCRKKSLKNETRFEPVKEPTKISLASNKWLTTTSIREVEVPIPSNFHIIFQAYFLKFQLSYENYFFT